MNSALLRQYHRLPPALRSAVATLHGTYLRAWRYGGDFGELCEQALDRERWSANEWKRWQEVRLGFVLQRAVRHVPFYREAWSQRRRRGDRASSEYLENWPVLEKESLRENPRAFIADDCTPARMFHDHTSGTTGKSLDIWLSRATVRGWYALHEARCRSWYGLSRSDRWGMLGGQLVTSTSQVAPPFWVWNAALRQLYMSSYHLAPASIPTYVEALRRYRVRFVLAYPSAIHAIAREVLSAGLDAPRLSVVIVNAEPLMAHQRTAIERAFSCAVRETYGMSEIVAAASECEHGSLHLWPEAGWLEVLAGHYAATPGCVGDFVATGLFNADMPLIRYRLGDRGAVVAPEVGCGCGRRLPMLRAIEGRTDDVLFTMDGREVGRMDPVFKSALPIREAQIIQERRNAVRVRFVPAHNYNASAGASVVHRIRERLGPVQVTLEPCESIPRTGNGKFRAVICALPPDERNQLQANA